MEQHLKINRNILDWEWFSDSAMVSVWIHILFGASDEEYINMGAVIKRGQLMINSNIFAQSCGISTSDLKTCIRRLCECGFISVESNRNCTIITVVGYEKFLISE